MITAGKKRIKVGINGIVQGVGFRPAVYRYANENNLSGHISNTTHGVTIELEGLSENINTFLSNLKSSPPPNSTINEIIISDLPSKNDSSFIITKSSAENGVDTHISPDIAVCPDCLREVLDPKNRRFQYPFTSCTNCGPRYTIIKNIPYDRINTTMNKFKMCKECETEYNNPEDRRFHAQPNACWSCGPELMLVTSRQQLAASKNRKALEDTVTLLKNGEIVAIKGLGGFHLACDALCESAIKTLRKRKYREDKPFALMADSLETIINYCYVSPGEESLLTSPKRPIVLLKKREDCKLTPSIAPNSQYMGFMLPYTPMHHLLFAKLQNTTCKLNLLVMTSGNIADEPIAHDNNEAIKRLGSISKHFLLHSRDIHTRCDDSVTRISNYSKKEFIIRRSRGYVPIPINIPFKLKKQILSCGAHLKNTFAFGRGNNIFISHHIGDLDNSETLTAFEKGVQFFRDIFKLNPELIAHDLHPDYLSTKYAKELQTKSPKLKTVVIQHHHAHIASCMADNGLTNRKVIGVAFDGSGYGSDNCLWGSEFIIADYNSFNRKAHLQYIPLPGGDQAVKEPWRTAISYLFTHFGEGFTDLYIPFVKDIGVKKCNIIKTMIRSNLNSPSTSSMGRLFDAVSSLLRICDTANYEGQAAIELELHASAGNNIPAYNYRLRKINSVYVIDTGILIKEIIEDLSRNTDKKIISAKFHYTISGMIADICSILSKETGINEIVLSGGVFQNMILLDTTYRSLAKQGFNTYIHNRVPTNDGGISLGQTVIADYNISKTVYHDTNKQALLAGV